MTTEEIQNSNFKILYSHLNDIQNDIALLSKTLPTKTDLEVLFEDRNNLRDRITVIEKSIMNKNFDNKKYEHISNMVSSVVGGLCIILGIGIVCYSYKD